jgi:HAD domain in Swiss Army Knife RNA repair proteins
MLSIQRVLFHVPPALPYRPPIVPSHSHSPIPTRILFIDIDGVLNRHDWEEGAPRAALHRRCVRQLNRVLAATNAGLVIASNWREWIEDGAMTREGFEFLLRTHGVVGGRVVGVTAPDEDVSGRGAQVAAWLAKHRHVRAFAILDDESEWPEPPAQRRRLVHVDGKKGLTPAAANRAIRLLQRPLRKRRT